MGKCTKIVSKLRQSVGLGKRGPTKPARVSARTIGPAVIPTNWKDKDWLEDSLRKYSASALIRAIGISRFAFYRHLNKIGYKLAKGNYSKNPCCTKAWCHRHYVELRYTLEECAALAHISRPKFADWLVKFKIPIRSVDDIEAGLLPVVVHKAICQLRPIKSVQSIVALNDYLRVKWLDRRVSYYFYDRLPADQWRVSQLPPIREQYERDLTTGASYPAHFVIPRSELLGQTILERDATIHSINHYIRSRGRWHTPIYPGHVLRQELDELKIAGSLPNTRENMLACSTVGSIGCRLMLNYFCTKHIMKHVVFHKHRLYDAIKHIYNGHKDLDLLNIILGLKKRTCGYKLRYPSPAIYMSLFRRLGIKSTVLDLHVGSGSRAVATAAMGLSYRTPYSNRHQQALALGFNDFFESDTTSWNGKERVDLAICDMDFGIGKIMLLKEFADRAKHLLAFVPGKHKMYYAQKYRPESIIPIKTNRLTPDFFFLW